MSFLGITNHDSGRKERELMLTLRNFTTRLGIGIILLSTVGLLAQTTNTNKLESPF
jgi:hypothetical protein